MRRRLAALALLAVSATLVPVLWAPTTSADPSTARLVVSFRQGTPGRTQDAVADDAGEVVQEIPRLRVRTVEVPASRADLVRKRLLGRGDVAVVEPDAVVRATVTPDDPWFGGQWGPKKVELPVAWGTTTGSTGITIAVVDTGVTFTNPDLASTRRVAGRNMITGSSTATDDNGHGTAAAGVAAMQGGNGAGGAGACWSCTILPVKVLGSNGSGSASTVAAGITWAVDNGADIISLSLGGGGITAMKNAVAYAESKGIPVVAAAGNDSRSSQQYPAAYPTAISVGATDQSDRRTSYSNYGSWVKVAAPGTNTSLSRTGSSLSFSGTSSATPLVSGVVALLKTANPGLTPAQIRQILMDTADPASIILTPGSGRIDAAAAMAQALLTDGGSTTTSTTSSTTSSSTSSTSSSTSSTTSSSSTSTTTAPGGVSTTVTGGGFSWGGQHSRSLTVKAGAVEVATACSRCSSHRIDIVDAAGTVVATATGSTAARLATTLLAGTYSFRFAGPYWSTLTYSITYLR